MNKRFIGYAAAIFAALGAVNAQADTVGLTAITVNGDKMVNDSILDVTWADVIPESTVTFYNPGNSAGVFYNGSAQQWVDGLNLSSYGGHSDWRLASGDGSIAPTSSYCTDGAAYKQNEMGCLFLYESGAYLAPPAQYVTVCPGIICYSGYTPGPLSNGLTPFSSILNNRRYWSGSAFALYNYGMRAWDVGVVNGYPTQDGEPQNNLYPYFYDDRAIAVRTGQTLEAPPPVTPIPATVWLLLSSIGGLGVFARKRKA